MFQPQKQRTKFGVNAELLVSKMFIPVFLSGEIFTETFLCF